MTHDCIIIGGGPAGYEAAAIGANRGEKVLLIEKDQLGGTCLNRGCIPTKAFCRSAEVAATAADAAAFGIRLPEGAIAPDMPAIVARKNAIVEQLREGVAAVTANAEVIHGTARFVSPKEIDVDGRRCSAPKILIATGSEAARLPIPGADLCLASTELLDITAIPASLAIIGGGVIGMEFASIFAAFGTEVTVIEYCKEILPPFDKDIAKRLRTTLQRRGIRFELSAQVTAVEPAEGVFRKVNFTAKGKERAVEAEAVLMAVGRRAVIPEGAAEAGFEITRKGFAVDARFETNHPGVYAVGDCNGICQLAHAASAQAAFVMGENIDLSVIPSAVFTIPECAMVGLTEEQCKEQGIPYTCGKSFFRANGKAVTMGETDGIVKTIVSPDTGLLLGCHICGPHAADLIAEPALALSNRLPVSTILSTIHSHPTLTETLPASLPR